MTGTALSDLSAQSATLIQVGNSIDLKIASTVTNGQYTLTTTAGSLNVHAGGGTTTLSTTFANTGTTPQDSLNYNTLTATGTGVGSPATGTTSGGPIAPGANGTGSASNTFTATTAGNVAVSNSATVSNVAASGTPVATNTGATINVYSGQSVWAGTGASGSWGTLASGFGANWGANQGSPGLDAGFTGVDTATFNNVAGHSAVTVNLNGASPNLNSITFSAPSTSYNLAPTSGETITLSGTTPSINVAASGGTQTISAPVIFGANTSVNVASGQQLTLSGTISGSGFSLTNSGAGKTILSNATGNTYSGGTTVSAGTLYVSNGGGLLRPRLPILTPRSRRPTPQNSGTGSGSSDGAEHRHPGRQRQRQRSGDGAIRRHALSPARMQTNAIVDSGSDTVTGTGLTISQLVDPEQHPDR